MKATIDIPDELYRKVKAKSALEGRPVRAVTIELFERWLQEETSATDPGSAPLTRRQRLEAWLAMGREASKNAPPGPTATEILADDRNRLERADPGHQADETPATTPSSRLKALDAWLASARDAMRNAPPGPTAREILEEDRNRLERR
ncbi:MAG: hypothetical protein U0893_24220 [Chloroflexota bacterium]